MPHTNYSAGTGSGAASTPSTLIGKVEDVNPAFITINLETSIHQNISLASLYRVGAFIKIPVENSLIFGSVQSIKLIQPEMALILRVDLLGELGSQGFSRGIKTFPTPGCPAFSAAMAELEEIFATDSKDTVRIGTIFPSDTLPATLRTEQLLSRHFAILGSTGTGKSSGVALLLHRLVEKHPNAHIVILDPHNEYERAFSSNGTHISVDNLALPYWLMNFEEHVELLVGRNTEGREADIDILKRCLLEARKKSSQTYSLNRLTVDTPIPYKLTDLINAITTELGKLDKAEEIRPFLKLKNKIEELKNDRRFAFMFSGMMVQDTLTDIVSELLRFPVDGRPISTLDLSGVPSDIVDVVVSLLSRLVFDFAMWSQRHVGATPILLVCEEAHRYVPHASMDTRVHAARKSLERIAKEGRKYGVSLGLVSQRPSDLSEAVLSQCGTIMTMRLTNGKDQEFVANCMPDGARNFLAALPTLQNRECIISGEGAICPMRVQLDYLDDHKRPASNDPNFGLAWRQDIDDLNDLVNHTIDNWRKGVRG
ncbi:MAG: ATP-binding protein [Kordiimonadaceae bacterium]|nr:ATP-binding protein [Kordiimonadaceae bacterium]